MVTENPTDNLVDQESDDNSGSQHNATNVALYVTMSPNIENRNADDS
jgi:hypothetical protein